MFEINKIKLLKLNFNKKGFLISLAIISVFICGKIIYKYGDTDAFIFLSKPVALFISAFYDSNFHYTIENGFVFKEMKMVIDKSCSGFNFFIICNISLLLTILIFPFRSNFKFSIIFLIPIIAYVSTIITNTFRIINLIEFQDKLSKFSGMDESHSHSLIGSFIYLTSLIVIYFIFIKFFIDRHSITKQFT